MSAPKRAVKLLAAGIDRLRPPAPGIVILLYHQIGAPGSGEVNLPLETFEAQLDWLAAHTEVVDLDDALARLAGTGDPLDRPGSPVGTPRPTVVITFDDGTADFVDRAVPAMAARRLPCTLYLATRFVDEGRSFWDDGTVLTWTAMRDVLASGVVTVGSHTHSHALLDRMAPTEAADELDRSIQMIEDELGVSPRHFAYPKALAPGEAVAAAVRARFVSAALAGGRTNPVATTDPYALGRTPVQRSDGRWFEAKAVGGLRWEGIARERLAARRTRGDRR